jgi:pimeloyl-ACP methyl ester carboxylesterase
MTLTARAGPDRPIAHTMRRKWPDRTRWFGRTTDIDSLGPVTVTLPAHVRSATVDLGGPTHYFDFGGNPDGPVLMCVHGLGGAAWNWAAVAPLLTDSCRVLAIDLAGHGRTPAAGRRTTVGANRRLLDRFVREVVGEGVVLVGNSMGGAISLLEAAKSPDVVDGLVLVDPALPRPLLTPIDPVVAMSFALMALPGLGEAVLRRRRRRRTPREQVRETLALCTVDASGIPPEVVELGVALSEERAGDEFAARDFLAAARSLIRMLAASGRFRAAMAEVSAPVLLMHGAQDRLVSVDVARRIAQANPRWQFEVMDGVGHVPQLEVPDRAARLVLDWLATLPSAASSSTR